MIDIFILLAFGFIICICIFLLYTQHVLNVLVKKNSTALRLTIDLNKSYNDLLMYSIPETKYIYTTKNLSQKELSDNT